jgi:hypothetical protein
VSAPACLSRPHTVFNIRSQRLHPVRALPSPGVRRRTSIRMPVVAEPIRPPRRPFRERTIPRTLFRAPVLTSSHPNGIDHEPNQDHHDRPENVASRIAIKNSRPSLRPTSRMPSIPVFVFQDRLAANVSSPPLCFTVAASTRRHVSRLVSVVTTARRAEPFAQRHHAHAQKILNVSACRIH